MTPRKKSPDSVDPEVLAEIQRNLDAGEFDDAQILLKHLPRSARKRVDVCRLWGNFCMARQRYVDAIEWFEKAIAEDPSQASDYLSLSEALLQIDDADRGVSVLRTGVGRADDALAIYERLELIYTEYSVDPKKVNSLIDEILRRYEGTPLALYKLGEAATTIQLFPSAINYFRQCLDQGYVGPRQHALLAHALAHTDHQEGAIHFYRKALKQPNVPPVLYAEVCGYLARGARIGNEDALLAVTWVAARKTGDILAMAQPRFFGLDGKVLEANFQEWLDELDPDADYVHLCEFFKNLLIFKKDHKSFSFKARDALEQCHEKLDDERYGTEATYYTAWLTYSRGHHDMARTMFEAITHDDNARDEIREGARVGLSMLPSASVPMDVQEGQPSDLAIPLSAQFKGVKTSAVWGADSLTDRMIDLLTSEVRRSIILVGPSAVGKTAAIRHLAWRLAHGRCPKALRGFRLIQTSTATVLSGAKYIGMWQERLLGLCTEGSVRRRTLIYWEDLANLATAGRVAEDHSRFLDVLIPRLERGEIVLIGEMLPEQARRLFGAEPQLSRVFNRLDVAEPSTDEVVDTLRHYVTHRMDKRVSQRAPEAISEAISLTQVFMPYKALPGKAVELLGAALDDLLSAGPNGGKDLDAGFVMTTFCRSTGIPEFIVSQQTPLEREAVRGFFDERILGQGAAVDCLMDAVAVFKSRLSDPRKPIRSFLFVGPTGVGKTEAAKVLAQYLFGSPDRMIRLNMSEFNTPDALMKLIGTPASGTSRASSFLEEMRTKPFSVVLLDEIEKADFTVLNLLLQLLDEGQLADADGKPAYFQSSIIIMTSNIGARRYTAQAIGFGDTAQADVKQAVLNDVKEFFSPEVFNRFDEVLVFEPLARQVLETIVNREIGKVLTRRGVIERNLSVEVDPLVLEHILKTGYNPQYGARHIKRAVEASVAVPLAVAASGGSLGPDDPIRINMRAGKAVADVMRASEAEKGVTPAESSEARLSLAAVTDRELSRLLKSTRDKIDTTKERVDYSGLQGEFGKLQEEMARPSFWDDAAAARSQLQRYAEVNRTLERVHRWERTFEQIASRIPTDYEQSKRTPKWRRSRLEGLLKDLESAELEALLEGHEDTADAFLLIRSTQADKIHQKWLLDLAGVYTRWAGRRGYRIEVFGEQPDTEGGFALMMHVSGMNAYGLLKNEQGVHRLVVKRPSGDGKGSSRPASLNCDCRVMVLPDVQPEAKAELPVRVSTRKVTPQRRGWKIKLLTRKVKVSHAGTGESVEVYTNRNTESDRRILVDFFQSYLSCRDSRSAPATTAEGAWGSLVRTMETGGSPCVRDHSTGIVLKRTQDFLAGKIDALLLERLV